MDESVFGSDYEAPATAERFLNFRTATDRSRSDIVDDPDAEPFEWSGSPEKHEDMQNYAQFDWPSDYDSTDEKSDDEDDLNISRNTSMNTSKIRAETWKSEYPNDFGDLVMDFSTHYGLTEYVSPTFGQTIRTQTQTAHSTPVKAKNWKIVQSPDVYWS